jgi:hypothetical protein
MRENPRKALGAHTYKLEDEPELPKSSDPHADEGSEVLEERTHKTAGLLKNRRFKEDMEGNEAKFQQRWYNQVMPALFRRTAGLYQRDYYTSANHEDSQGVKDRENRLA